MKKEQSSLEKGEQLIVENFKQYGLGLDLEEDLYHMFQRCLKVALADQKRKIFSCIGKILQEWNCQNNPKIRTTINTVQMRIGDFKTEFEELM